MSRILRRPMFRGGPVDSRGTGITTGLDQPRIGARTGRFFGDTGNPFVPKPVTTQGIIDAYTPRGLPQSFIDFFKANQANQRPTGRFRLSPGATLQDAEGLLASNTMMTDGSAAGIEEIFGGKFGGATEPPVIVPSTPFDPDNIYYGDDDYREELPKLGVGSDREKDLDNFYDPKVERDTGLEAIRQQNIADLENIDKMDTSPKEVKTPKGDDDEPEVTMTDLEKALGLDKARQEYAADALAAASKAFFEGKGFGAIADAAAVKSKAPDIKRLAGLEEFKAKKAKELYREKLEADAKVKAGTRGAFEKKLDTITKQKEGTQGHVIALAEQKLQPTIQGQVAALTSKNFVRPSPAEIIGLMVAYYPQSYKGKVSATDEMTGKEAGTYITEDATTLIFWDGESATTQSI